MGHTAIAEGFTFALSVIIMEEACNLYKHVCSLQSCTLPDLVNNLEKLPDLSSVPTSSISGPNEIVNTLLRNPWVRWLLENNYAGDTEVVGLFLRLLCHRIRPCRTRNQPSARNRKTARANASSSSVLARTLRLLLM
jgi:hypothetical protein